MFDTHVHDDDKHDWILIAAERGAWEGTRPWWYGVPPKGNTEKINEKKKKKKKRKQATKWAPEEKKKKSRLQIQIIVISSCYSFSNCLHCFSQI